MIPEDGVCLTAATSEGPNDRDIACSYWIRAALDGAEIRTLRRKEERLSETTALRMVKRITGVTPRNTERSHGIRRYLGVEHRNESEASQDALVLTHSVDE